VDYFKVISEHSLRFESGIPRLRSRSATAIFDSTCDEVHCILHITETRKGSAYVNRILHSSFTLTQFRPQHRVGELTNHCTVLLFCGDRRLDRVHSNKQRGNLGGGGGSLAESWVRQRWSMTRLPW
jgi:hypothetical protein